MFIELRIRNLAVLSQLTLPLEPGLNVVTGETGAGKSIVVDALKVLLGGRASSSVVRSGASRATVEALAEIEGLDAVATLLSGLGLESEDGTLILRREIPVEGRSRGWVNGSPVTAETLRRLGSLLVDIHGQHEHQRLLRADFQQQALESFGGCRELAGRVADVFGRISELRARRGALRERRIEVESRAQSLRFQLDEIAKARIRAGEDEELRREANRLANSDLLAREASHAHAALDGGDDATTDRLADAVARLERLASTDRSLESQLASLRDAYHEVADVAAELARYFDGIEHDPERLHSVMARQALLERLMRRYGPTLDDVVAHGEKLQGELDELDAADLNSRRVERELKSAKAEWEMVSEDLSGCRRRAAEGLARATSAALPGLGMKGARFEVSLEAVEGPRAGGGERVRFLATMNPGFPLAPLAAVASGGELSRAMLALRSVLGGIDELPTLVFDEIDAGIGGMVADKVGQRLEEVARGRQVLAVTHLARVAARASNHLSVEKLPAPGEDGAAVSVLTRIEGEERVREIARMLGGDPRSESSLRHARELLSHCV
ncbi:MAG: DNA repair protein RecN [Gemmatimonadetes bacterium]|nr:DNA repair protein RecN [Gemmatimonadota bacterium]